MRAALLLLTVVCLCPVSVVNARVGLYAYTWFALMRPDYLAWAEGSHQYSLWLAICTALGSMIHLGRIFNNLVINPFCQVFVLLTILFGFSVLTAQDPTLATEPYQLFLRVVVMSVLIPLLIETEEHFRRFYLVAVASIRLLGLKWGVGGLLSGGAQYRDGAGGFLSDNNCTALAFAMAVPLCWYARSIAKASWAKTGFLCMVFGSMGGIVWTHSRGGVVALAVVILVLSMRSKHKVSVLLLMILMAAPTIYLVRDSFASRMATLENPMEEASARGRIEYWIAGLQMWKDHPLQGVGFGSANFQKLLSAYLGSEDEHVAHNTYVQVLADSGLFAEIVYLGLLFGTTIWLGRSAKRCRKIRPGLEAYPLGLQTSLVAFIVGSTFLSRVTFDFYYVLIMMAASWYLVEKSERFRKQPGPTIMLTTSMPVSVSYHPAFGPLAEVKNKDLPTNA